MGGIGGGNPLAFEIGGTPSSVEQAYDILKQLVGIGGSAEDGTIEAEWRFAKSRGLVAAFSDERSMTQHFPDRATDFIPIHEEILGLVSNNKISDEERRQRNVDKWTRQIDASAPGVEAELQAIDSRFSLIHPDRDLLRTTVLGRAFEDYATGSGPSDGPDFNIFGTQTYTEFPNFSDDFRVVVFFNIGGTVTPEHLNIISRAETILDEVLPSWVTYSIITNLGFYLDISQLDYGAFNP